jgi:hypothetical protein
VRWCRSLAPRTDSARMGDDVDTLLALMGGDAPPPPRVAAASVRQKLRAGRAGPPGRQDLPEQQASELWNPTVRWNPGAAVAPAAPLRRPSAHVELARQKAVRSLQARFKAQCDALNTGWSEPEVNKNFECWMLDSSIRRPTDGGGGGGGGGGGNNDPLLPPPKTAGEDPGLRKALFASAKLQRKTAFRFCSDMQKAVSKAHRTLAQLAATGGGQNRTVRVNPATVPAAESAQQWQREHEQKQQPMLGWDGKAMLQIRYGSTSVLVNQCHWDKLATMLRLELGEEAAAEPAESGLFKERVLCLLSATTRCKEAGCTVEASKRRSLTASLTRCYATSTSASSASLARSTRGTHTSAARSPTRTRRLAAWAPSSTSSLGRDVLKPTLLLCPT